MSFSLRRLHSGPRVSEFPNPTLFLSGKACLETRLYAQKPIFAGLISTGGLDDTNKSPKDYFCVISVDANEQKGTMLFVRSGKKASQQQKHHRTVFALDCTMSFVLNQMRDEHELELILNKAQEYAVVSLTTKEKYMVKGRFIIRPAENASDQSLSAMCKALLRAGLQTTSTLLERFVSEEKLTQTLRALLTKVEDGVQKRNVDNAKLSSLFKLVDEAITTEAKYLSSYDRFQVSMKQIQLFLCCLGDAEIASYEPRFSGIMFQVDDGAYAALNALEVLAQGLQDIDFIVSDDSQKVIRLCQLITESASYMHQAEEALLIRMHEAFFLLKEMQENTSFLEFTASLELANENKKLIDFLGSSMQRVTRRPLLLDNLRKELRELSCFTAKQLGDLEELLEIERQRAMGINDMVAKAELSLDVIVRQVRSVVNLAVEGRECILRVRVQSNLGSSQTGVDMTPVILFVFNDCVVIARTVPNNEHFVFHSAYSMIGDSVATEFDSLSRTMRIGQGEELALNSEFDAVHKAVEQARSLSKALANSIPVPTKEQRNSALAFLNKIGVSMRPLSPRPRPSSPTQPSLTRPGSPRVPSPPPVSKPIDRPGSPQRAHTPTRPGSPQRAYTPTRPGRPNSPPVARQGSLTSMGSTIKQPMRHPNPVRDAQVAMSNLNLQQSTPARTAAVPSSVIKNEAPRPRTEATPLRASSPLRLAGNSSRTSPQTMKKQQLYDTSKFAVESNATPHKNRSVASRENQVPLN